MRGQGTEQEFLFPRITSDGKFLVYSPLSDAEWTADIRDLLERAGIRRMFISRISTHSCRRGGVQMMLDLGYSFSVIMEIGGWDSVEAFFVLYSTLRQAKK